MNLSFPIEQIQELLPDSTLEGGSSHNISALASLEKAKPGDLSFLGNPKYRKLVPDCKASLILVPKDYDGQPSDDQAFIRIEDPSLALSTLCSFIEKALWPEPEPGIHPSAVIDPTAEVDPTASVGPLCVVGENAKIGAHTCIQSGSVIGRNAEIGKNCWIMPNVSILDYCHLGNHVRLHSGVVLGSDGFGYDTVDGQHRKAPQLGRVVVHDSVEIGANTTVDRARFDATIIGEGTKIDNLVQIGHNVRIGRNCIIVALTGIAGSTTLEDYVVLGGQVGIVGHVTIGAGAQIGSQSGINNDVEPKSVIRGAPAYPIMFAHRLEILKKRLPEIFKRVSKLEELCETLEVKA